MNAGMITPVISQFDSFIDSLIDDYGNFNFEEDALGFLATKTRNFISFNRLTLNSVIFGSFSSVVVEGYSFDDDVDRAKSIMEDIFSKVNVCVDNIIGKEEEEEHHHHGHDHSHVHHYHIDVDSVQSDVDLIKSYLYHLKDLIDGVCDFLLSVFDVNDSNISDLEFKDKYASFKSLLDDISSRL